MLASKLPSGKAMAAGLLTPAATQRQLMLPWLGGVKAAVPKGRAVGVSRVPVKGTR